MCLSQIKPGLTFEPWEDGFIWIAFVGGWSSQLVKPFADVFKAFRKVSERDFKVSNGYNEWYIN